MRGKFKDRPTKDDLTIHTEGLEKAVRDLQNDAKENNEEIQKELEKHKRLLHAKLDAVYFDDEIDEIKGLITVVSEMSSNTAHTQQMIDKVKSSKRERATPSGGGGARITEEQRLELETIL